MSDNARQKTRECWLAVVQMALRRYSGVKVDVDGTGQGIPIKRIRAEVREYAREAIASMLRRGDIPAGLCKPEQVRVTVQDNASLTVNPPPKLVKWWDEKKPN